MLDRLKLAQQVSQVSGELFNQLAQELNLARQIWDQVSSDQSFYNIAHSASSPWALPTWDSQLILAHKAKLTNSPYPNNPHPKLNYNIVSTDGSQVYPDRQMGTNCFLLNIGTVAIQYRTDGPSQIQLTSEPTIYTGVTDLDTLSLVELVDCKRQELELQAGLNWFKQHGFRQSHSSLFLIDGALIFWQLENGAASAAKKSFWNRYLAVLHQFYSQKIWYAGYISLPNSKELVNLLRVALSISPAQFAKLGLDPRITTVNSTNSGAKQAGTKTTTVFNLINDVHVANFYLQAGEYSLVFQNQAAISKLYPPNLRPHFVYFNTGAEIARVEFPAWIAQDLNLVDQIMGLISDQVVKGRGYPAILAEAHEQAVVSTAEREFFYQLLDQQGRKIGQQLTISRKLLRKKFIGI